ncbi:MAG: hypothetical protein QWI73_05180 [Alphaproteobacteria bacterium]|nr:hypothetical protein [Alphaproteobacteria bacterium]
MDLSKYIIGILLGLACLAAKFYFSHPSKDKVALIDIENKTSKACLPSLSNKK